MDRVLLIPLFVGRLPRCRISWPPHGSSASRSRWPPSAGRRCRRGWVSERSPLHCQTRHEAAERIAARAQETPFRRDRRRRRPGGSGRFARRPASRPARRPLRQPSPERETRQRCAARLGAGRGSRSRGSRCPADESGRGCRRAAVEDGLSVRSRGPRWGCRRDPRGRPGETMLSRRPRTVDRRTGRPDRPPGTRPGAALVLESYLPGIKVAVRRGFMRDAASWRYWR